MERKKRKSKGSMLFVIAGLILLLGAGGLALNNFIEAENAGRDNAAAVESLVELIPTRAPLPTAAPPTALPSPTEKPMPSETPSQEETPAPSEAPQEETPAPIDVPAATMPSVSLNGEDFVAVLEIPSVGLSVAVQKDWSYPKLRRTPCRYYGSVYDGDIMIAAHNYPTHFGRLKDVAVGAEVRLTDMEGNVFEYSVSELTVLQPDQGADLFDGDWDLTMFTCTKSGKARVVVRCKRSE